MLWRDASARVAADLGPASKLVGVEENLLLRRRRGRQALDVVVAVVGVAGDSETRLSSRFEATVRIVLEGFIDLPHTKD
jgi:hypothetical protein